MIHEPQTQGKDIEPTPVNAPGICKCGLAATLNQPCILCKPDPKSCPHGIAMTANCGECWLDAANLEVLQEFGCIECGNVPTTGQRCADHFKGE